MADTPSIKDLKPGQRFFWHHRSYVHPVEIAHPHGSAPMELHGLVDIKVLDTDNPHLEVAFPRDLHGTELEAYQTAEKWTQHQLELVQFRLSKLQPVAA